MFLELTNTEEDSTIYINSQYIISIEEYEIGGTEIVMNNGTRHDVAETAQEIFKIMKEL